MRGRDGSSGGGVRALVALGAAVVVVAGLGFGVVLVLRGGGSGGGEGSARAAAEGERLSGAERAAVVEAVLDGARGALRRGRAGAAVALLEETLARLPNEGELWLLLADARFSVGDAAGAYEAMSRGIVLSDVEAGEMRFSAALYALEAGLREEARVELRMAERLEPGVAKYPLHVAMIDQRDGRVDAARAAAVRATRLDPALHQGWGILGQIALDEGRHSVALGYVGRARELAPGALVYAVLESRILRRENRPEEAAEVLLSLDEGVLYGDAVVVGDLALCFVMLGDRRRAAGVYERGARVHEGDASLALEAAKLYAGLGDVERARELAVVAMSRGSEEAAGLIRRLGEDPAGAGGGSG